MGTVTWHGEYVFFLYGEEFYSCGANIILCSTYTSVYPQNIFSTSFMLWAWLIISNVLNSLLIFYV